MGRVEVKEAWLAAKVCYSIPVRLPLVNLFTGFSTELRSKRLRLPSDESIGRRRPRRARRAQPALLEQVGQVAGPSSWDSGVAVRRRLPGLADTATARRLRLAGHRPLPGPTQWNALHLDVLHMLIIHIVVLVVLLLLQFIVLVGATLACIQRRLHGLVIRILADGHSRHLNRWLIHGHIVRIGADQTAGRVHHLVIRIGTAGGQDGGLFAGHRFVQQSVVGIVANGDTTTSSAGRGRGCVEAGSACVTASRTTATTLDGPQIAHGHRVTCQIGVTTSARSIGGITLMAGIAARSLVVEHMTIKEIGSIAERIRHCSFETRQASCVGTCIGAGRRGRRGLQRGSADDIIRHGTAHDDRLPALSWQQMLFSTEFSSASSAATSARR